MSEFIYGFIGAGNMGGTLARAAAKSGCDKIFLSDRDTEKVSTLAKDIGAVVSDNLKICENCDFIFLGVKPQILPNVLKDIAPVLSGRAVKPILVSMAAGISVADIEQFVGNCPIIRIMPNTPAVVGEGMILYCANKLVTEIQLDGFKKSMSAAGKTDNIAEGLIDAAGCVSGCGPAFAYMFIQSLADGGVQCGMPRDKALLYAAQTVLGAAKAVIETGKHPDLLKDEVCSPGGTTIEGVHALEDGAFRADVMNAVSAAYEKTLNLKK